MICFLTSSPFLPDENALNPANGFVEILKARLPHRSVRGLFVASSPDDGEKNAYYARLTQEGFEASGVPLDSLGVLERRSASHAASLLEAADLIILAGGHVPTQNQFFLDIGLQSLLQGYGGVLVGISAGTMNAAFTVYAQPELPGEAASPTYRRFLTGLGLTQSMIIPHFDGNIGCRLDGLRLYADVTLPDSVGRRFYLLPDGSYIHIESGIETLRGEAWLAEDGVLRPFCADGDAVRL